jgi:hypothetical protein
LPKQGAEIEYGGFATVSTEHFYFSVRLESKLSILGLDEESYTRGTV